jgi:hypothetical protein
LVCKSSSELDDGGDDDTDVIEEGVGESLPFEVDAIGELGPARKGRVGGGGECDSELGDEGDGEGLCGIFCANCDVFARGVGAVMVALEWE